MVTMFQETVFFMKELHVFSRVFLIFFPPYFDPFPPQKKMPKIGPRKLYENVHLLFAT